MTRLIRVVVLTWLVAAAAGAVLAQESLGKRVSLDLKGTAPAEAFKTLGDAVGMPVTMDQAVTAPVDILVRNVTARTALTTICESIGCRWSVTDGALVIKPTVAVRESTKPRKVDVRIAKKAQSLERVKAALSQKLPADMKFENTPLTTASERLSAALGLQLTITSEDPAVQTLTADLGNHTLQSGLRLLSEQAGAGKPWRMAIKSRTAGDDEAPALYIVFGGKKTAVVKRK
jgi:hypothetical protein